MKVLVILNPSAGTLAQTEPTSEAARIKERFAAVGMDADVRLVEGKDIASTVADAVAERFDAVIAGGGDGTLNTIAAGLAGTNTAFGVLPLGTFNHFAKEVGVPLDLDRAIAGLAAGSTQDLDIGEVNGRVFLNFSSIGLHPLVVKHRDAQRTLVDRPKKLALLISFFRVVRILPLMRVRLTIDGKTVRRVTPSVIVCNNTHQMEVFGVSEISSKNRSLLNVYLARSTSRLGMLWLLLRAALRRLNSAAKLESIIVPMIEIDTRNRHARVSIDGEIVDLKTPLKFRVRKAGLKVVIPRPPEGGS